MIKFYWLKTIGLDAFREWKASGMRGQPRMNVTGGFRLIGEFRNSSFNLHCDPRWIDFQFRLFGKFSTYYEP